jgi:hypothetical protein
MGWQLVWDTAKCGARAIAENGRPVSGRNGPPMLGMEANTFIDMEMRGVKSTRDVGVHYTIED